MKPDFVIKPSQLPNLYWVCLSCCVLLVMPPVAIIMLLYAVYLIITTAIHSYSFYEDYIVEKKGLLVITEEQIHYYRIRSLVIERPFWLYFLSLANIRCLSTEPLKGITYMKHLEKTSDLTEYISLKIAQKRKMMGLKPIEF